MGSFRQEPYLWVHLAGLATVPLWLDLCLVGLATGIPRVPPIIELALLVLLGSGPILWMQWRRPFSIFSLLVLVLPPDLLTEDQRRILRLFKSPTTKALSLLVPLGLTWTLLQLYRLAPIAASVTPLHTGHTVGFLVALVSFLACNLFIQVPLSVLRVLAVRPKRFALVDPYPAEDIPESFTMLGLRVNKILPEIGTVIQPEAVDGADAASAEDEPATDEPATDEPETDEPVTDEPVTDEPAAIDEPEAEAAEAEADLAAVDSEAGADDSEDDLDNENAQAEVATTAADLDSEDLEPQSLESDGEAEDFGDDPDEDLDADFDDSAVDSAGDSAVADVSDSDAPVSDLEAEDSDLENSADPEDLEVQDPEAKDSEAEDFGDDPDEDLDADFGDAAVTAAEDGEGAAEHEAAAADDSTEPTAEADKEISE